MAEDLPQTFSTWMQLGQTMEAEARFPDALAAYDRAIALLRGHAAAREIPDRRALGLAWMNRGNTLQKLSPPAPLEETLRAYDEAIALFASLPCDAEPLFRNHLGAAWLNRGHALLAAQDLVAAATSLEEAVALLQTLPVEADPHFRLNLAGAWTNLAHATLPSAPARALEAARAALATLGENERAHEAFAAMSLRARRALVMAIGEKLRQPDTAYELAHEATDAIEDGLALERDFEAHGYSGLRPLAARLFRLGVQIYRAHQPHFLAEFVLESLSLPALAADPEFRAAAETALGEALADAQRPQLFVAGQPDSDRRRDIAQSLRAAQEQLTRLTTPAPTSPS